MATTYEPIATTTLGSAAATITFSSIPASYTDLRLVFLGKSTTSSTCYIRFNGDTATNYSFTELEGNGSSAASYRVTSGSNGIGLLYDFAIGSTYPVLCTADIFSYAGSTFKTVLTTGNDDTNGSGGIERSVGLWRSTSAITQIDVRDSLGSTFSAGTTATLYGIKNA